MKVWKAADAKRRFSELIHSAAEAPQLVELRGRPVSVVVSYDRFKKDSHLSAEKTVAEWLEQFDGDWK